MDNLEPVIRNAARAVILKDNAVLLLRKKRPGGGERYALPGGGQDAGETLADALKRECMEEIATGVRIVDLLHVADFFKLRDTVPVSTRHLVEFLFLCEVADDYVPANGHHPDKSQIAVVWMPLDELDRHILFPPSLPPILKALAKSGSSVYLGTL